MGVWHVVQRSLFCSGNIFDLMQRQKEQLRDMVYRASPESLDDPELAESLVEKCCLDVPVLDDANKYAKTRTVDIDVSRDPTRRFFFSGSGPNYIKGQEITIYIPFRGDGGLFDVRPTTFDTNPPKVKS